MLKRFRAPTSAKPRKTLEIVAAMFFSGGRKKVSAET